MPEYFKVHGAEGRGGTRHVQPKMQNGKVFLKRSSAKQGYGRSWQKLREWWLRRNPLCVECAKNTRVTPATDLEHIVPHKGDKALFYNTKNLQGLCKACHSRKTASEDGGFGNRTPS